MSIWDAGVELPNGARFLVENNHLTASGPTPKPHGGPGNAFQWGADELIIRHNLITQGGSPHNPYETIGGLSAASNSSNGAATQATDGRVYHNTIVKNRGVAIGMFHFGSQPVELGRHVFINNFIYGSNSPLNQHLLALYWDATTETHDRYINNVWGNPGGQRQQGIVRSKRTRASLAQAIATWSAQPHPTLSPWHGFDNVYDAQPGFQNYDQDDYRLAPSSVHINAAAPLTVVVQADRGQGTQLRVADARFFYAEAHEFPAWMGVQADWIAVGPRVSTAQKVQIRRIDDASNTLTLSQSIARQAGDFVWLWKDSDGTELISGAAPDIGALEFQDVPTPPERARLYPPHKLRLFKHGG